MPVKTCIMLAVCAGKVEMKLIVCKLAVQCDPSGTNTLGSSGLVVTKGCCEASNIKMAAASTEQAVLNLFVSNNKPYSLQNLVDLLAHQGGMVRRRSSCRAEFRAVSSPMMQPVVSIGCRLQEGGHHQGSRCAG
jgi:hypothetical protein